MDITPELVISLLAIVGAGLNYWYTKNKSAAEARDIDATAAGKLSDSAVKLVNELQEELREQIHRVDKLELSNRAQEKMLQQQQATIQEQGGIIMQLRDRVTHLETENGNLKAENAALKSRGGKL